MNRNTDHLFPNRPCGFYMDNRIDRAEYLIYKYVEVMFVQLRLLVSPDLALAMNMPAHDLPREALVVLLYRLFQDHSLVASRLDRGLFTPVLDELEAALDEDPNAEGPETYYGATSIAIERFRELSIRTQGNK